MSEPIIWGPDGHSIHLGRRSIVDREGHHVFPHTSFGAIQTDYGTPLVSDSRYVAVTMTSDDQSILIESDHKTKTIHFSISKEFLKKLIKEVLEQE